MSVTARGAWRGSARAAVVPSPNIWQWPDLYEVENRAQDVDGAVWRALAARCDWAGRDVVDVGCGDGFHLPHFATTARRVIGVEPHPPLVRRARRRVADLSTVEVTRGTAERLPLPDASVDLVHARTAYFFGPGCDPGIDEANRVLRPGGVLAIVDLDTTVAPYGRWMLGDLPAYRSSEVDAFFTALGFACDRVRTRWEFADRAALEAVLRIEFSPKVAAAAIVETPGTAIEVGYRVLTRARPDRLIVGRQRP